MADREIPQIYLITPPQFGLSEFPGQLAEVLDAHDVACVRLALATRDEDTIARAGDAVRSVCHDADVAIMIEAHVGMVERLGLDGVHLTDGARSVRKVRKDLGGDAIVGAFCGGSRHDGITAAEQGADYISFGPVASTGLGDGSMADRELFVWWSEMIEVPVVAEGGLNTDAARLLSDVTDFVALGEEIWRTDDPVFTLTQVVASLTGE